MCEVADSLKKILEIEIEGATTAAIESGVHTGVLQAKTACDLHMQLCEECKPNKPWVRAEWLFFT